MDNNIQYISCLFTTKRRSNSISRNTCFRLLLLWFNLIPCLMSQLQGAGIVSLAVLAIFLLCLAKENIVSLVKFFPLLVNIMLAIMAVGLIDYNAPYLPELRKQAYYTGAVPLIIQYYILFIFTLEKIDGRLSKKRQFKELNFKWENAKITRKILNGVAVAVFCILGIMFLRIATKPYYLLKIDRFTYRSLYITGIWLKLEKYMTYAIPVLFMNWRKGRKKIAIASFALYVLYYLWQGEKYSAFMGTLLFVLLFIASQEHVIRRIKKIMPKLVSFVLVLIFIVLGQYYILYGGRFMTTFTNRIAQQGQLWWSTYDLQKDQAPNLEEITDEFDAYTETGIPSTYGIYKIMYLSAPKDVVTSKILSGSNYTESTAASIYYYFGSLGLLVISVFFGLMFAWLGHYYCICIKSNYIIESLLLTKMISDFREMFSMSRFTVFFSTGNIVKWIIILACVIIRNSITMKKKVLLEE